MMVEIKTPYEFELTQHAPVAVAHDAYRLFTDGNDFVIASDEEDVKRLLTTKFGYDDSEVAGPWRVVPRDESLTILFEDPDVRESKPCDEWIKAHGPGWLCSLNY